uniref:Uncharacterized protein n=1 Tax=Timema douglasi TaxID=61478 RepID=A0A7R8VW82_TIMDO|nr:unnamed protein product [Timema douglasi]
MVGEEFSRKPYAIAVQQGSPLKDQFNNAILQLLNKRKLEKLKETWWNQNPERKTDCEKQDDQSDGISIQNIGGVFIVIFVGIGMACVTLAFEYWWYKYKKDPRVVDVAPSTTNQKALVMVPPPPPTKLDGGITMGFRPRNPYPEQNFRLRALSVTINTLIGLDWVGGGMHQSLHISERVCLMLTAVCDSSTTTLARETRNAFGWSHQPVVGAFFDT